MLVGFTVKCGVIADCSQWPSVSLSVVSVSPLSLSLFISQSYPMFSSPALSLFLLTSQFVSLPHLNPPLFLSFEMNCLISFCDLLHLSHQLFDEILWLIQVF